MTFDIQGEEFDRNFTKTMRGFFLLFVLSSAHDVAAKDGRFNCTDLSVPPAPLRIDELHPGHGIMIMFVTNTFVLTQHLCHATVQVILTQSLICVHDHRSVDGYCYGRFHHCRICSTGHAKGRP